MKTSRRPLPADQLGTWFAGIQKLEHGIERDCVTVALFTGLRKDSVTKLRWEHVELPNRQLFVFAPKGGEERSFHLPLSDYLVRLLQRRQAEHKRLIERRAIPLHATPFVFPAARGKTGHIVETRWNIAAVYYEVELKAGDKKVKRRRQYTMHDLRRTFATVAESLDISPYAIKALLNHRSNSNIDVTGGYIDVRPDRLREPMQRITDRLLELIARTDLPTIEAPELAEAA